jgi:hypothetical protein
MMFNFVPINLNPPPLNPPPDSGISSDSDGGHVEF